MRPRDNKDRIKEDKVLIEVPAGPFLMGSSDADEMAFSVEKPQHKLGLPAFKIGKYPVTNRQYAAFVTASGHPAPHHWSGDAPPRGKEDHPVVYVSWHDARRYCEWLTDVWRAESRIGKDEVVRLPSEAEWEKAARGPDGRIYPWGDDPDPNRANYNATGIGRTSAVGCFPDGASPYSCQDMSGNVWEWCATRWQDSYLDYRDDYNPTVADVRVVRGGSFINTENFVRCALRSGSSADGGDRYLGFRVAISQAKWSLAS